MKHQIINYLCGFDFLKDLFLIALGSFIPFLWGKVKIQKKHSKWKKKMKNIYKDNLNNPICSLANASSHFSSIQLNDSNEKFILSSSDLDESFIKKEECIFNNKYTLSYLGIQMGIENFNQLVQKHKKIVANEFNKSRDTGRSLFNNIKYGVRKIIISKSADQHENYKLIIDFYETDYYTHKVMRSIYHELMQNKHEISTFSRVEDIVKYYPFMTSFGVDSLLLIKSEEDTESKLVVTKRSAHMANMTKDLWHVSMNEGLSITDKDTDGAINLYECVVRGYREEMGIKNRAVSNKFRDLFMVRENFEMGISSLAEIDISPDNLYKCFVSSEDGLMESSSCEQIVYDVESINEFLKDNETTDVGRYCLEMCLSRM